MLYSVKLSFESEGEIKAFSDKQKWGYLSPVVLPLQEMLKESLQREEYIGHKYKTIEHTDQNSDLYFTKEDY